MRPARAAAQALAWLLVAVAVAACGKKPSVPHLATDATVLAFGDSITYGTGANPDESYPAVLAQIIHRKVINAGVPGETTAEGLQRLPKVLDDTQPNLVLLCLGGNDFLRRQEPAAAKANLARMIEMIRGRNIPVVLIAVPQIGLLLSSHPLYRELAKQYQLPIENDAIADILGERELKSDAIHPNAVGYRQLAKALADLLATAGAT
jgi:lysophospholipase L1-like esterase